MKTTFNVVDEQGEYIDTISVGIDVQSRMVVLYGKLITMDIFMEVFNVADSFPQREPSFNLWRYGFDDIVSKEARYYIDKPEYFDSDDDILTFNRSMIHAVK